MSGSGSHVNMEPTYDLLMKVDGIDSSMEADIFDTSYQKNQTNPNDGESDNQSEDTEQPSGFGIYHGNKEWLLNLSFFSTYPSFAQKILKPLYLLWRYNFDIFRLKSAVKQAVNSFDLIYDVLNDTQHEVTYFESPMDIWAAMKLQSLSGITFHDFLDALGLYRDASLELQSSDDAHKSSNGWDWRKWMPGMGCMRSELVTAMTINTYNQDLNQMNGLVGLVAYVPAGGELFSIEGGNHQLMESALYQSRELYDASTCKSTQDRIQRHQKTITTVVASENSMELYEDGESLGSFDIVILAAPLQMCRIQFLVKSPMAMDEAVLHDMPLNGIKVNYDEDVPFNSDVSTNEHGQHLFANSLLPSATTPYMSVVTTLVSNATLNATHFGLQDDVVSWPRSMLVSERGKHIEEINTLTILSFEQGLVKTFSSQVLDLDKRNTIFGKYHVVEYVQVWGGEDDGKYGGATPSFGGGNNSESLPFLLYDGGKHYGKGDAGAGPALYYVNAIESAVSAIEISAIGAKSTAKLVSRRLGLIQPKKSGTAHDEL